jgi:hypothetical protein
VGLLQEGDQAAQRSRVTDLDHKESTGGLQQKGQGNDGRKTEKSNRDKLAETQVNTYTEPFMPEQRGTQVPTSGYEDLNQAFSLLLFAPFPITKQARFHAHFRLSSKKSNKCPCMTQPYKYGLLV